MREAAIAVSSRRQPGGPCILGNRHVARVATVSEPSAEAMPKPQAIVVMGVAGSGKSTIARALARHYGHAFLDADDFHTGQAKAQMAAGVPLSDEQREPWVALLQRELRLHARQGRSVVLAFSGLRASHRQRLRESGVPMRFVFLHAAPAVLAERLAARADHFMPPQLLGSQFDALQLPDAEPDVIVVDATGPLAQVLERLIAVLRAAR
jgi:gluconokinase